MSLLGCVSLFSPEVFAYAHISVRGREGGDWKFCYLVACAIVFLLSCERRFSCFLYD